MHTYLNISSVSPPIMSLLPSPSWRLTSTHRPDPAPQPVPVARGKTACLLIRFLIEFLPPFLRLVNPCTGLWADDWRVITGCWHVCFLWASLLILLTAKAAKSFCWSISALRLLLLLLPSVSYLLSPISLRSNSLCSSFLLYPYIWGNISPLREFKEWELRSERERKKKKHSWFSFQDQEERNGALSPFCNHFLCWSIEHGISQCRGQVKLLHSLRTHVNKTASR